jgi:hypothetical protein
MTDPETPTYPAPARDLLLAAAGRVAGEEYEITTTDLHHLAQSLLSIARQAMPNTAFAEDPRVQLARAFTGLTLGWARDTYWEDTCGDCVEGRCHWGGEQSRQSIEAVKAGGELEDAESGKCGCARHTTSVLARQYGRDTFDETVLAWQAARDADQVIVMEGPGGDVVWVSRATLEQVTDEQIGAFWDAHLAATVAGIPDKGAVQQMRDHYIRDIRQSPWAVLGIADWARSQQHGTDS